MNNYNILGIPQGSSKEDIKKAYRRLAHIHHPDKGGRAQKFSELNKAYSELMKDEGIPYKKYERKEYKSKVNDWEKKVRRQRLREILKQYDDIVELKYEKGNWYYYFK